MARAAKKAAGRSLYSVHPGVAMLQKWIAELKDKTGRSVEEWLALVKESGPADEKACREWLKAQHGFGTNSAWWLAERAFPDNHKGITEDDPETYLKAAEQYVEAMFAGPKAGLRPIYDQLLALGLGMLAVALRYRPLTPLFLALVIVERGLMSLQGWVFKAPANGHHPPEHYASPVTVVLAVIFLVLSLRPRQT